MRGDEEEETHEKRGGYRKKGADDQDVYKGNWDGRRDKPCTTRAVGLGSVDEDDGDNQRDLYVVKIVEALCCHCRG